MSTETEQCKRGPRTVRVTAGDNVTAHTHTHTHTYTHTRSHASTRKHTAARTPPLCVPSASSGAKPQQLSHLCTEWEKKLTSEVSRRRGKEGEAEWSLRWAGLGH